MERIKTILKNAVGTPKRAILAGAVVLVLLSGIVTVQVVRADGRILPNVTVGGVELGGLTPDEARARLRQALEAVNVGGVQFKHQDRTLTVRADDQVSAPPSQSPITYDIEAMVDDAFAFGHDAGPAELLRANLQALFLPVRREVRLDIDEEAMHALMDGQFGALEKPAKDAGLVITRTAGTATTNASSGVETLAWKIDITPDATGAAFDYDAAIAEAAERLQRWEGATVGVGVSVKAPDVTAADAEAAKPRVLAALKRGDVTLAYDDMTWSLSRTTLETALELRRRPDGQLILGLKRDVIEPLLGVAAEDIDTDPKPTSFKIDEARTRVTDFVGGTIGRRVDHEGTLARIEEQFETSENAVFPIAVDTSPSPASDPLAEELGIREMIGYGTSNFAGSPVNRRKNIANGARLLNGLVIKPGEEFGLIDRLKPFDAKNGYFPELVIKENRTVPEYGGGLCQIGTTTFRATMGAGLPITQRQNHSYRVVYYEPVGTDATLYDPAPDYRFVNDTKDHVVLITKQIGDTLRFEFWGTRDGRVQSQSEIKQWNHIPAPAPKLIETSALPEGQRRCFETAHAGLTTAFDYTITYPDGSVKTKEFRSVYRPWQAQCLVGKAGAPNINIDRSGALVETAPPASASGTPATPPPAPVTP